MVPRAAIRGHGENDHLARPSTRAKILVHRLAIAANYALRDLFSAGGPHEGRIRSTLSIYGYEE